MQKAAGLCVENAERKVCLRRMTETILACPLFGRRVEFRRLTRRRFGRPQNAGSSHAGDSREHPGAPDTSNRYPVLLGPVKIL